jgi:hypothetical protein
VAAHGIVDQSSGDIRENDHHQRAQERAAERAGGKVRIATEVTKDPKCLAHGQVRDFARFGESLSIFNQKTSRAKGLSAADASFSTALD